MNKSFLLCFFVVISWQLNAEEINLLCEYANDSEVNISYPQRDSHFSGDTVLIDIDLKKKSISFNEDSWKYVAWSEGKKIKFTTKIKLGENALLNDISVVMGHYNMGEIDRETGLLNTENYTKQEDDTFLMTKTKQYLCEKYKFKF